MTEEIRRKRARSEAVDYSDPVELHDSSQLRIELIPFYIGKTFAAKIIRYDKTEGGEQTAISLQPQPVRRLHEELGKHLAIAEEDRGNYLVVRTDGSVDGIADLDLETIAQTITQLLRTEGVAQQLSRLDLGAEILRALRTEFRLRELRDSVAELTNHLREGIADEHAYQQWCEAHSWAFGNAYVVNDTLRNISATDQVDLLLPLNLGGFRDLIELKRPDTSVLNWDASHHNYYWTAESSRAIGQCHRYLDVLHSEVGDGGLRDSPEVVAYHPRATVVIGRSNDWGSQEHKALHGLNRRLSDISVITYDHLLAQARRTLELMESPEMEGENLADSVVPDEWGPDEAPF
jgi:hypothetical protein